METQMEKGQWKWQEQRAPKPVPEDVHAGPAASLLAAVGQGSRPALLTFGAEQSLLVAPVTTIKMSPDPASVRGVRSTRCPWLRAATLGRDARSPRGG